MKRGRTWSRVEWGELDELTGELEAAYNAALETGFISGHGGYGRQKLGLIVLALLGREEKWQSLQNCLSLGT